MEHFLRDTKLTGRWLENENPGSSISDGAFARELLRKSGLNRFEQRRGLSASGASWGARTIEDAPRPIYGDAHMDYKGWAR